MPSAGIWIVPYLGDQANKGDCFKRIKTKSTLIPALFNYLLTLPPYTKILIRYMKTIKLLTTALVVSLFLSACHSNTSDETTKDDYMSNEDTSATTTNNINAQKGITQKDWGNTDGKQVHLF